MAHHLLMGDDAEANRTLRFVAAQSGERFDELDLDPSKLALTDRLGRQTEQLFAHTPEELLASWRTARRLMKQTQPGDVVLISDRGGLGGIFALMQKALPEPERRHLWTTAADSHFLDLRLIGRTHANLPDEIEHRIDWEIAQYRFARRVLATSERARAELLGIGVESELIRDPGSTEARQTEGSPSSCWVPGPVGRRNQSGDVLRAAAEVKAVTVTLSTEDSEDAIWSGTTWEALAHVRSVLGERVTRQSAPPDHTDLVVLGDPYRLPDAPTRTLIANGAPLAAPTLGTVATSWLGVSQWSTSDDLTAILQGSPGESPAPLPLPEPVSWKRMESAATAISVGIPVFRDIRFLDECLRSAIDQTIPPHEIVLVDDGSATAEVDVALEHWAGNDPRIKVVRASHRGVCAARNTALAAMEGDSFVFLDSDDTLEPTFLEKCSRALSGDDRLWAVATWTRFFGTYDAVEAKPPFDARVGIRENTIISTTVLADMRIREHGIAFEPDLAFLYCEDWHLWAQIIAAGGAMGLVPEALANHRVHPSSGGHLRTQLAHAVGKSRATAPLRALPEGR